jgi:PAS domain S-box-containing protein
MTRLLPLIIKARSPMAGVLVGLVCTALAAGLRLGLDPLLGSENIPWAFFILAVLFGSVLGGRIAGLTTIGLSAIVGDVLFVLPHVGLRPATLAHGASLLVFLVVAVCVGFVGVNVRRFIKRERRHNLELEQEVRRRQEAELSSRKRAEELDSLLGVLPLAVWIGRDSLCQIIEGNPAANALLGVAGGNVSASAPPGERAVLYRMLRDGVELSPEELPMQRAARTRRAVLAEELDTQFADGRRMNLLVSAVPLLEPDGSVRGAVCAGLDISDRTRAQAELARDNETLARLHALGERCASPGIALQECLHEVLATAMWITGAPKGNLQLYDEDSERLRLAVHSGLPETFVEFFATVDRSDPAVCGASLEAGARLIVEDVLESALFAGQSSLEVLLDAGVRAVQSTPLKSGTGTVLGVVSTHFAEPHRLTSRECRYLDILARQTADYLEGRRRADALRQAAQHLRIVTDGIEAPVAHCDRDLKYVWVSQAMARWLGRPGSEIEGQPIAELIGPEAFGQQRPYFEEVLTGRRVQYEMEVPHRGAGKRWINATYTPTFDAAGACDGWVAVVIDVDARRRTEDALRESEQRFRALADSMPVHVWMHDEQGRCRFANARYLEFSGLAQEQLLDERWLDLLHLDERQGYVGQYGASAAAHSDHFAEVRMRRHDGTYRWFQCVGRPRFEGKHFAGYVGVSIDVTDRRDALDALKEAARQTDEFLAMLGHELRNPLAAIQNAIATVSLDEQHRDSALAIARRQAEQLGRIVDDLLDVARITQGRIALKREPILFQTVVERALEASKPFCEARGHTLSREIAQEPICVEGDATRLEQVLVNLLSNACKYTNPHGRVSLSLTLCEKEAVIRIRDSGIGIAPEGLRRVFELFAQAERSLDRAQGGLGIGLTVAQRIVAMHGGQIEALSDGLGKGAEFVVRLPALDPGRLPAPASRSVGRAARSSRVLVVEDNSDSAESLRLLLKAIGHQVDVANSGLEALEMARTNFPEVMLVDIGLPGLDGYEVARRVRSDPLLRPIILIALTGYGREEDRRAALAAGFDHHLVKPVSSGRLEHLIRSLGSRGEETAESPD